MPVIPATQEAEAGELPDPGGRGCGEPKSRHCTPAWVTRAKLRLKKKKKIDRKEKRDPGPENSMKPHLYSYEVINLVF